MGKGSNTTTQTTAPNPAAMSAYNNIINQASNVVANNPYQAYTGQLVAGVNQQQNLGIGNINANAGFAMPFINQAAGYANAAAQPLSASQIQNYMSPYTQQVVGATEAQLGNINAQQQNQLVGNAAAQGALGGDRLGVAQGVLAGQQAAQEAPVIAGLYNQGYGQALQTAMAQQQQQANAAYSLGNLGVAGQNAALTGAGSQIGAGTLQQQTQQQLLNALYGQYQIQQAFPYQQLGWEAGIDTGVGSQMGGTSTTTAPSPNPLNQIAGLGIAGAGAFGNLAQGAGAMGGWSAMLPFLAAKDGGRISGFADGGGASSGVPGSPYGNAPGYLSSGVAGFIPSFQITPGRGAPPAPQSPSAQNPGMDWAKMGLDLSRQGRNNARPQAGVAVGSPISFDPSSSYEWQGPIQSFGDSGADLGGIYARGGKVAGFADGGAPFDTFDDRFGNWSPVPPDQAAQLRSGFDGFMPTPPRRPADVPGRGFASNSYDLPPEITGGQGGLDLGAGALGYSGDSGEPIAGFGPSAGAPAAASGQPNGQPNSHLWDALLSAGLGMMASRSPFLGVGIGEGGLAGFKTYLSERQQDIANQQKQQTLDRQVQQLNEMAKYHQGILQKQTEQIGLGRERLQQDAWKPVTTPYGEIKLFNAKTGAFKDAPAGGSSGVPTRPSPSQSGTGDTVAAGPGDRPYLGETATLDTMQTAIQQGLHGPAMLDAIPPNMRNTFEAIANYDAPMSSFSQFKGMPRYIALNTVRAINPDYNATYYNEANKARSAFGTGPQGDAVRAFNVGISHLDTLNNAVDALGNSDVRVWNAMKQRVQTELGLSTAPTSMDAIKPIVAAEVTKAIIGARMTEGDRQEIAAGLRKDLATMNLKDVIGKYQELMGGQLRGLERQFVTSTHGAKDFDDKLSPAAAQMLQHAHDVENNRPTTTQGGAGKWVPRTATGPNGQKITEPSPGAWGP